MNARNLNLSGAIKAWLATPSPLRLRGVRHFSTTDLRVTAARIIGIESDHRTLARVVGGDVAPQDGGPIETITGFQEVAESADPPNNDGQQRIHGLRDVAQAQSSLVPVKEMKSPSGFGRVGVKGSNAYDFVVSNPAAFAALMSPGRWIAKPFPSRIRKKSDLMIEGLFQPTHLILIFGIALLVFGPKKLPELGKGLGMEYEDSRRR